ncbi:TetR/AcrR family transcriptional regulator [Streptomyces pactum]|uniref:TetR/AcrR family transcriptional regulator n=1 Tax=Streptomyces pactum TaxID=68249 RepID=UPI0036F888B4
MREVARRNREQILRAAREIFVDQGPDAPLDAVARRAGVGIATLYRRFPDREQLIRAVAVDVLTALTGVAREALDGEPDPAEALRACMHAALDLKIGSVMPALAGHFDVAELLAEVPGDPVEPVQELLDRARRAGLVRADVAVGDIAFMIIRLSRPLPGGRFPHDEELAHRHLDIYFDGLRAPGAHRPAAGLPAPVIDADGFRLLRGRVVAAPDPGPRAFGAVPGEPAGAGDPAPGPDATTTEPGAE